jgi:Tfp pilus assembly protein PilN
MPNWNPFKQTPKNPPPGSGKFHWRADVISRLTALDAAVAQLRQHMDVLAQQAQAERKALMATEQDNLAAVQALRTAVEALIALTDNIFQKLSAGVPDQATIDAINAQITQTQAEVNDAMTRDTPPAPPAPPTA